MGKGSIPRPFSVTQDEYANRWDAIFGRDKNGGETPAQTGKTEGNSCPPQPPAGQPAPPGETQLR